MEEEHLFDYARGLNAPYWIQEIRYKGQVVWYFSTPMQVSYFVIFALVLILMMTYLAPFLMVLHSLTKSMTVLLYYFIPNKLARLYTEYEPHGKKMHLFLWDWLVYTVNFGFNRKSIYRGERTQPLEQLVFEKTTL